MNALLYCITLLWLRYEAHTHAVHEHFALIRCDFHEARYWRAKERECRQMIAELKHQRWMANVPG